MKVPSHFVNHAFEYILVLVLGAMGLGAMAIIDARQDARHLLRVEHEAQLRAEKIEKFDEQIMAVDDDDARLRAYNSSGSEVNKPARLEIMEQNKRKRERLVDRKATYVRETPVPQPID